MRILVLGGTGRTGSLVCSVARAAGHEVTVLARDPSRLTDSQGLRVLSGNATSTGDVARAMEGQEGLISALGSRSMLRPNIARPAAAVFVPLAETQHLRRVIVMSAFGVGETSAQASLPLRVAFATVLRGFANDKTEGDRIVARSSLDWTLVYPVTLADDRDTGRVVATARLGPARAATISRAGVADFMVASLTSTEWSHRPVILATDDSRRQ